MQMEELTSASSGLERSIQNSPLLRTAGGPACLEPQSLSDKDLIEVMKMMQEQQKSISLLQDSVATNARQLLVMDTELNTANF